MRYGVAAQLTGKSIKPSGMIFVSDLVKQTMAAVFIEGYNQALELAAKIAEDRKWYEDPKAMYSDQPASIAIQIRELKK